MRKFRSQRLEKLLGTQITAESLTWKHLTTLKDAKVREAADLDYKLMYGTQPSDRHKPGGDVAAMANTQGGLIIIGADEDDDAQLTDLPGVPLSDKEHTRLLSLIGDHVHPYAEFEVIPVPDPERDGIGCYVIAVPRSPRTPHGVLINEGYRWPRRIGHTTTNMSEPELATRYRARFALARDQRGRIDEIEENTRNRCAIRSGSWVVVSLVPDLPGDMVVNWDTFAAFKREFGSHDPVLFTGGWDSWERIVPGPRCLMLDTGVDPQGGDQVERRTAQLYTDGSGVFALHQRDANERTRLDGRGDQSPCCLGELALMISLLSGVRFLARYARDSAYAGGDALIRVRVGDSNPVGMELGTAGVGTMRRLGQFVRPGATAERAAPLDELADDTPQLVATTAYLVGDIMRCFGHPDVLHMTTDGQVTPERWGGYADSVRSWAETAGIKTL
ncbi:AlbA family DNA-binding domain-containing protein [Streptosporangium sandarakinum]|uniref:AlbA family DNA-binding domain-containing protein n=1 Tax=Streptosporangium sandarakinum TaxID=1260955 RepID=UPI0036AC3938